MQQGWIKLHRSLMEHWLHDDKPFCRFGAWVDLLLMANHDARKIIVCGSPLTIEQGQLFTSTVSLGAKWGWSRSKVERFLTSLENDLMIERKRTPSGVLVTLVNYSIYQDSKQVGEHQTNTKRTCNEHQTNIERTSDEHQTNTNKNDKNEENVKNERMKQKPIRPERFFPDNDLLEKTFADFRDMRKKIKAPMTDRAVDLMVGKIKKLDPGTAVKMLEQSIMNGWKDIYELKDDKKDPAGNTQKPQGRFTNFEQRNYSAEDFAAMERRKLGLQGGAM